MEDPVVNKVLQEMMTMGIERPAKAATVPVPEPREPFLQKEEDLGTATGPEGRVPRGQNKIFGKRLPRKLLSECCGRGFQHAQRQ